MVVGSLKPSGTGGASTVGGASSRVDTAGVGGEVGGLPEARPVATPSAIAFVQGDPVEAAKGLRDFARVNPLLVIKGGVLDGKLVSAAEIAELLGENL